MSMQSDERTDAPKTWITISKRIEGKKRRRVIPSINSPSTAKEFSRSKLQKATILKGSEVHTPSMSGSRIGEGIEKHALERSFLQGQSPNTVSPHGERPLSSVGDL